MAATDLYDLCAEYLTVCNDALALTPGGAISRAFVSAGAPAWDCCPQLSVHVGGPAWAMTEPAGELASMHRLNIAAVMDMITLTATVIRCVPTLEEDTRLPSAADLDAAGQLTTSDLWAIWNLVEYRKAKGTLFGGKCREMALDPAVPVGPAGGCGGWQIQLRVTLQGYDPEGP